MTNPQVPSPAPGAAGAATTTMAQAVEAFNRAAFEALGRICDQETWDGTDAVEAGLRAALPLLLAAVVDKMPDSGGARWCKWHGGPSAVNRKALLDGLQSAASRLTPPPDGGGA